jgi:antitoxin YefM
MHTSYRLNASELDHDFLESVKALFQDKEIEIVVYDVDEEDEQDETAYLAQSEANHRRLIKAMQNIEKGKNLVEVNPQVLEGKNPNMLSSQEKLELWQQWIETGPKSHANLPDEALRRDSIYDDRI